MLRLGYPLMILNIKLTITFFPLGKMVGMVRFCHILVERNHFVGRKEGKIYLVEEMW